ncbi:MAG TPA: hypothetical protein VHU81_06375 [Thermoanaerobaculia bacterium]|jgi:hypothetical protein|nr:hypothetical protein [Thermoanaerobaculia bacterium]
MAFTGKGFTGTVTDDDFADLLNGAAEHGVVSPYGSAGMECTRVVGSRSLRVDVDATSTVGRVQAPGVLATLTTPTNATAAPTSPTNNRIDMCVARFTWATNTVALVMKEGTPATSPVAPALTQDPGNVYEVPLATASLTTAATEYTAGSVVDRRYWMQAGHFVAPSTTTFPSARPGALLYHPDTDQLRMKKVSGWALFNAQSDSGILAFGPYGGFQGSIFRGYRRNGMATLVFATTKMNNDIVNLDIDGSINGQGLNPVFSVYGQVRVTSPYGYAAWSVSPTGDFHIEKLTANAGAVITGTLTYPVGS